MITKTAHAKMILKRELVKAEMEAAKSAARLKQEVEGSSPLEVLLLAREVAKSERLVNSYRILLTGLEPFFR